MASSNHFNGKLSGRTDFSNIYLWFSVEIKRSLWWLQVSPSEHGAGECRGGASGGGRGPPVEPVLQRRTDARRGGAELRGAAGGEIQPAETEGDGRCVRRLPGDSATPPLTVGDGSFQLSTVFLPERMKRLKDQQEQLSHELEEKKRLLMLMKARQVRPAPVLVLKIAMETRASCDSLLDAIFSLFLLVVFFQINDSDQPPPPPAAPFQIFDESQSGSDEPAG